MKFIADRNSYTLSNIDMRNVKNGPGNTLIDIGTVKGVEISNAYFENITSTEELDEDANILFFSSIDLDGDYNITIEDITATNCVMNLLAFGNLVNELSSARQITMHNISYTDSYIDTQRTLISTDNLELDGDLSISMSDITFSGIHFYTKGDLILFQHQLSSPVEVDSLTITDITSGQIEIVTPDQDNTDISTQVSISNGHFFDINDQFTSLIIIEGAVLNISDSDFTQVYTQEEGAVLFAGLSGTEVHFNDCIFSENSALAGSLFYIETESKVTCTSCTISNNAAFVGGVVQVRNNGHFEFYNSTISNNFGYYSPIAEILDSSIYSIFDSTQVYDNQKMADIWDTEYAS